MARDRRQTNRRRRRLALLALLLVVVLLGAGIGTFVGDDAGDQPPVVTVTPTESPTPSGSDGDPTATPAGPNTGEAESPTAPATQTPTPTPVSDGSDDPTDGAESDGSDENDGGESGGGGDGSGGNGDDGDSSPSVSLSVVGSAAVLGYDDVAPGRSGRETIRVRNAGSLAANLTVEDVAVRDAENGIVQAEAGVDDTPESGELSANVLTTVSARYPDGRTTFLYGTGGGARSLRALGTETDAAVGRELEPGETATLVLDWHVPPSTGNEIQSDGAEVDLTFGLRTN